MIRVMKRGRVVSAFGRWWPEMPRARFVEFDRRQWTLSELARTHGLPTSTLAHRIERFGATTTGIQRALATGTMSARDAGRIGASRSPWRKA